ncbi:vacuolar ATP synthase subunit c, putative [Trypanosoma brucei brucei TREU927]|uniref:V-type proton ATPase subunit C n=1 Tax=Trypanosoma brucei brucei (strain 927/4 GUTat10.1) TaxID=185431 RepID=Q388J5_TRYB2|nr:vacuolar ATP synthase subunit c, putative [Trypanosoma brucei brucei TREU927]EAN78775.1 vacuolar ATP synthase subunit c, putative [Trypanosoma brucei brucei TREU927]
MSEHFLLLGLPFLPTGADSFAFQYKNLVSLLGAAGKDVCSFAVPNFKVGTLDSLIEASDELAKLDLQVENSLEKQITIMQEICEEPRDVVATLRFNQTQEMTPAAFVKGFQWSSAQFDSNESILGLVEKFANYFATTEEGVRLVMTKYNETRNKLTTVTRKAQGNLSVKPIRELVTMKNRSHPFIVDTELLTNLFVAVPLSSKREWLNEYWSLNDFVCPDSNCIIAEDSEFVLNSIVVFRRVLEDVKLACRKRRYIVRDSDAADEPSIRDLNDFIKRAESEKKNFGLVLRQRYTGCYVAWVHLKAVRLFVESLLKYGLPPRCISIFLQVDKRKEAEIRKKISQLYPDLSVPFSNTSSVEDGSLQYEYPYVSIKMTNLQRC